MARNEIKKRKNRESLRPVKCCFAAHFVPLCVRDSFVRRSVVKSQRRQKARAHRHQRFPHFIVSLCAVVHDLIPSPFDVRDGDLAPPTRTTARARRNAAI